MKQLACRNLAIGKKVQRLLRRISPKESDALLWAYVCWVGDSKSYLTALMAFTALNDRNLAYKIEAQQIPIITSLGTVVCSR